MARVMRSDFAHASVGLTLPAQKKNLQSLHDWLVDEQEMPTSEQVVALTNYQQGRFGRLPNHILIVTNQRVAFTHDGGLRSIPIGDVNTSRIGLNAGLVNGAITIALTNGETLTFRRGMSLAMQEVAAALTTATPTRASAPTATGATGYQSTVQALPEPPTVPEPPAAAEISDGERPSLEERTQRQHGAGFVEFVEPITAPMPVAINGGPAGYGIFAVWALGPDLEQVELLVNTTDNFNGVVVIGQQGPIRALQVDTDGSWATTILLPDELPVLGHGCTGTGDAVIMMNEDLSPSESGFFARVTIQQAPSGVSAVSVHALGESPALLVNDTDPYVGSVVVPPGTQYVTISAPGAWRIAKQ